MIKDYRFSDVKKYLKTNSDIGNDILDTFDNLFSVAILAISPMIEGDSLSSMVNLLETKDKLFDTSKKIYNKIVKKLEPNYLERMEQIKAAYSLIYYTSYFEALCDELPHKVSKRLKLKLKEKNELIKNSLPDNADITNSSVLDVHCNVFFADHKNSFYEIQEKVLNSYDKITKQILNMISNSSIYNLSEKEDAEEFEELKKVLEDLPRKAEKLYVAQYVDLSNEFPEFALYVELHNFSSIHTELSNNNETLQLLADKMNGIDVGFVKLHQLINSNFFDQNKTQSKEIIKDLTHKYKASIEKPIIKPDRIISEEEKIDISFPKIVDAFIPQSYKCFNYQDKGTKLENNKLWEKITPQNDLDKFLVKYLYSPDAIDNPLIILGHPGSGKSLLTKVLSAQLMSESCAVIRIPLREVNAESTIDILVEEHIKKVTNRSLANGYAAFAQQFEKEPLTIILDGFDELLQAKGDIFSTYLEKAKKFQQDQKSMNRPVRIIITSRITLIDKAVIPENSTIVRLLEFNEVQKSKWIDIWNRENHEYFSLSKVKKFCLPTKGKNKNIDDLSEQPLLLLMLAIYDFENNELNESKILKRTELYDNLIRRFVRREQSRYYQNFNLLPAEEQSRIIESEVNRLGVAAMGMFNRETVVITSEQYENDLDLFNARNTKRDSNNTKIKDAESQFGKFLFVHESKAKDGVADGGSTSFAYEFLHNTFGEFLAADFILRNTLENVRKLYLSKENNIFDSRNEDEITKTLTPSWFFGLIFVPLYSRPVIVDMLQEHVEKSFQYMIKNNNLPSSFSHSNVIEYLKMIVVDQIKLVLNGQTMPIQMQSNHIMEKNYSLMEYMATYSMNIIILLCTICSNGFKFMETEFNLQENKEHNIDAWNKLVYLWKSSFSLSDLVGLSKTISSQRIGNFVVHIKRNKSLDSAKYKNPIDVLLCVSNTLSDDLLFGLSGLHTTRFEEITQKSNNEILKKLKSMDVELYYYYLISIIRNKIQTLIASNEKRNPIDDVVEINNLINKAIEFEQYCKLSYETAVNLLGVLELSIQKKILLVYTKKNVLEFLMTRKHIGFGIRTIKINPLVYLETQVIILILNSLGLFTGYSNRRLEFELFEDHKCGDLLWVEALKWLSCLKRESFGDLGYNFEDLSYVDHSIGKDFNIILNKSRKNCSGFGEMFFSMRTFFDDFNQPLNQVLLETCPEDYLKFIYTKILEGKRIYNSTVFEIVNKSIELIHKNGLFFFGFNSIKYLILILKKINAEQEKQNLKGMICEKIDYVNSSLPLKCLVEFCPSFIAELINFLPRSFVQKIISKNLYMFCSYIADNNETTYLIDLIKVFKAINKCCNFDDVEGEIFHRIEDSYNKYLFEKKNFLSLLGSDITISELNDIIWMLKFIGNINVLDTVERKFNIFNK